MARLPLPPQPEPRRISSLEPCAPRFRQKVERVLERMRLKGHSCLVFESVRTNERQAWLYGFGRTWEDAKPRGRVTNAPTAEDGLHFYGLAVDIVEDDATPWVAPNGFWFDLREAAEAEGLRSGQEWKDSPHVQWKSVLAGDGRRYFRGASPTAALKELRRTGGEEAVWRAVGALEGMF